jgi:dipeptidyl aminopeptidase/acylaminoacyl peptidase
MRGNLLLPEPSMFVALALAAFTPDDLVRLKRLTDPQVSPDSRYVAYVLSETDMEANKRPTDLWLLDLQTRNVQPKQLTRHSANDSNPRWSPDASTIYFLSTRSGSSQVWRLRLAGGEATQVTNYPVDVASFKVAPGGDRLALSMEVFPDCADLKCTATRLEQRKNSKQTGKVFDRTFIRHWDAWIEGPRSHLFVATFGSDGTAAQPVDLSQPLDADVPSKPFGGDEEYTFSPDGRRLVFAARVSARTEAWSTNFDLFEVSADGAGDPKNLTDDNDAWDTQPMFLPNGDLAYLAMERPTFEADRFHIVIRDGRSGAARPLTKAWDRSVDRLGVTPDGGTLLATTDDIGQHALYAVDPRNGTPRKLVATGQVTEYSPTKNGVVIALASLAAPVDLHLASMREAAPKRLTSVNQDVLGARAMSEFEQFSFKGWNGETAYGYVMKPFGFSDGTRFPVAYLIHGGPQVSFQNQWSYRWNAQAFAGRGYGVVFIDYHGSPGYGQAFTDSISKDWGDKPLEDLQKGLAAALERYNWLDGERVCAAGASYGGFMANWIAGKWSDRFRCLVNHDGIFDQRSMYYSTEELWFPEWDFGGPYFDNPELYEKYNPANFVKQWRTPMLVIHGELDYRVPDAQGIATFTALQRRGIESRLVIFPDENHWVLKPNNSLQWHAEVLGWLDRFLKPK